MDDQRFDRLARALGGAATRRSALAALAGLLAGGAALDAEAKKKRKKRCNPACAAGQTCRQGTCTCDNGGAVCGTSCCAAGQTCQGGTCVDPQPQCLAFGATCKNVGVPCCDDLVCGSGQSGAGNVGCYVPAGGSCLVTADCVWFAACEGGVCVDRQPQPQPPVPPAPACTPTFPVTADAGANGLALQQAVKDAATGDTIVLAPGDYRIDGVQEVSGSAGLLVTTKELTIERCAADAVVNLVFPSGFGGSRGVEVNGTGAALTLRGVTLEYQDPTNPTYPVFANGGAAMTIEDVTIDSVLSNQDVVFVGGSSPQTLVTIKGGVTIRYTGAGSTSNAALYTATINGITCSTVPVIEGFTRCSGTVSTNCAC